jgi:hypothetical protein
MPSAHVTEYAAAMEFTSPVPASVVSAAIVNEPLAAEQYAVLVLVVVPIWR